MAGRAPEEIRNSIEANRAELAVSLEKLRGEIVEVTDWRKHLHAAQREGRAQLRAKQREALIGAAAAGFVLGGGIAGFVGLFRRR